MVENSARQSTVSCQRFIPVKRTFVYSTVLQLELEVSLSVPAAFFLQHLILKKGCENRAHPKKLPVCLVPVLPVPCLL